MRVAATPAFPPVVLPFAPLPATLIRDEDAVDVDPRASEPCAAWKRVTVVFTGCLLLLATVLGGASLPGRVSASLSTRESGAGVGGGERNATFFGFVESTLATVPVALLSVAFLLPVAVVETFVVAGSASRVGGACVLCVFTRPRPNPTRSSSDGGRIDGAPRGLYESGSLAGTLRTGDRSIGGRGRADSSGSGLAALNELGVVLAAFATRGAGGHSRRGGSSGSFSRLLDAGESVDEEFLSADVALPSPRLKRLKSAFMAAARQCGLRSGGRRRRCAGQWAGEVQAARGRSTCG